MSESPITHLAPMHDLPSGLTSPAKGALTFGIPVVDDFLKSGRRRGGLHEFYAAPLPHGKGEEGQAAAALALLLGARACTGKRPLMWVRIAASRAGACPYAPGLAELGMNPDAMMLMEAPDLAALMIAGVDSVRHGGLGAVVMEVQGRAPRLDLTASRRLALAAECSGTTVLLVRSGAVPTPSAAHSRWEVASAPSTPLAANAPGHPVFDLTLLRQRGGPCGLHVQLEWNREQAIFRTSLSGSVLAVSAGAAADRRRNRAA